MSTYTDGTSTIPATGTNSIITAIRTTLLDAGWSEPTARNFTVTSGGKTSTVVIQEDQWGTISYPTIVVNGINAMFPLTSGTMGTRNILYTVSAGLNFFFLRMRGPDNGQGGAYDASYGSPTHYVLLTTMKASNSFDNTANNLQVVVASNVNGTHQALMHSGYAKVGLDQVTANRTCEFMYDRVAIQDDATLGDAPTTFVLGNDGRFGSKIKVIDTVNGFRGVLDNIAYVRENYFLGNDSSAQGTVSDNTTVAHQGYLYQILALGGYPNNTTWYHPLGKPVLSVQNSGGYSAAGPLFAIKRGTEVAV